MPLPIRYYNTYHEPIVKILNKKETLTMLEVVQIFSRHQHKRAV